MILVKERLGRDYYIWDRAAGIEFLKPGKGTVAAEFVLGEAPLDAIRAATAGGEKYLHWFTTDIVDAQGDVVARVRKQVYARRKRGRDLAARDAAPR